MANLFRIRRSADEDGRSAGGNMMRTRRRPAFGRSPYDRPKPLSPHQEPPLTPANPKWLSGFSFPARAIASGACKIFSTVIGSDSSSSSSSGVDTDSDHDDDVPAARDDEVEKMRLIQQLVICETFSRKECDDLIRLIQSRVVDGLGSIRGIEKDRDLCSTAVMEARALLKAKNSGLLSNLKMEDQMCETGQGALLSVVSESKTGSPMAMAKSYTDTRPAWSSPSLKHVEFAIPTQNSKVELSNSIFLTPLQLSEMKKTRLSAGSWNILEEIRKVRSKATEELLTSIASNANLNASLEQAATSYRGLAESAELEPQRIQNEVLPANTLMKQPQDDVPIQVIEITGCQLPNKMHDSRDSAATGHPFCLSAADQTPEPCDREMIDVVNSSEDNAKPEHQAEASNVLRPRENDGFRTGSQNSSNAQHEDSLQYAMRSLPKVKVRGTPAGTGRRGRGYSRRGRGRAK